MVYNNIEKFYSKQRHEKQRKLYLIQDQVVKCFFDAHPPSEIKAKIKEAIDTNKKYLPTFSLRYELRRDEKELDETRYVELVSDLDGPYMLVDFDFHNINRDMLESTYHMHYKKQLKSDFTFKIEGRIEDGSINLEFMKIYRPFLFNLF
jgi:hypothetical protein